MTLLDDRGWSTRGPSDVWYTTSPDDLAEVARTVARPDEPPEGRSHEAQAAMHWAALAATAQRTGVRIESPDLASLPHEVDLTPRIRAGLG